MGKCDYSAVLFSKSQVIYAEKLRDSLKSNSCELTYATSLIDVISYLNKKKTGVIFADKCFSKYVEFLNTLTHESKMMKFFKFVFIDDEIEVYNKILLNKNISILNPKAINSDSIKTLMKDACLSLAPKQVDLIKINAELEKLLMWLGFSQKLIGFNYIKDAILVCIKGEDELSCLQKDVYPMVALKHNTQIVNIERNIRSAVKDAFHEGTKLYEKFNSSDSNKITNRAFLNFIVSYVLNCIEQNKPLRVEE